MQTVEVLKSRHREILNALVREYIETGEPVASRTLAKRRKDWLSAASIRNVMGDLADEGYLSQPHTSAGRIPTEKAFRHYVASLTLNRAATESERLKNELRKLHTVEERVERSSQILMEMTRNVGIAAAIPALAQELDQIELVPLGGDRVLMVVVTRGAFQPDPDGDDAQRGDRGGDSGAGPGAGPDRTGAARRRPCADGGGNAGSHGAQPRAGAR